jgi:hypothetical protein
MNDREMAAEDIQFFRDDLGLGIDSMFCPLLDHYWDRWDDSDYKCRVFCYKLFPISNETKDCPCHYLSQEEIITKVNEWLTTPSS